MANVEYPHSIIEQSIKYFVRVTNERDDMNAGTFGNALRSFRALGDARNNTKDTRFHSRGYGFAECKTVSGYLAEVGRGAIGVFDLHARRNVRNAASICCWVATPLRSASSIACSSSVVA